MDFVKDNNIQKAYVGGILALQIIVILVSQGAEWSVSTTIGAFTSISGAIYVSTLVFKWRTTFFWAMLFNAGMLYAGVMGGVFSEIIQQPMFFVANLAGLLNVFAIKGFAPLHKALAKVGGAKALTVFLLAIGFSICWTFVSMALGSQVPVHDGLLGGIAITAQVFSIAGHSKSWFCWMALNALSCYTWILLGNYMLAFMYLVFLANAVLGYLSWSKTDIDFKK